MNDIVNEEKNQINSRHFENIMRAFYAVNILNVDIDIRAIVQHILSEWHSALVQLP